MKFFAALLVLGLLAIAQCEDTADADTGLSQDEVIAIIQASDPTVTCINWKCRTDCQAAGNKAGYCAAGACTCVAPLTAA